jgi:hypothetical protein
MTTALLVAPWGYLPALTFLALLLGSQRCRTSPWTYPIWAVTAITWQVVQYGWLSALITTVIAVVLLIALISTGLLTRTTTFALPVLLLTLPVTAWVALVPGFLLALAHGIGQLRRREGSWFVFMVANETVSAMGAQNLIAGSFMVNKPDLARIPTPKRTATENGPQVPMLSYLGLGLCVTACLAAVLNIFGLVSL